MGKNRNAKNEFLNVTDGYKVIGAKISFGVYFGDEDESDDSISFTLNLLYNQEEYNKFLVFLDREYDAGYGGQELYGTIICENGVWMDRGEYDGSEWWNVHEYPDLKEYFGEVSALKYERFKKLENLNQKN